MLSPVRHPLEQLESEVWPALFHQEMLPRPSIQSMSRYVTHRCGGIENTWTSSNTSATPEVRKKEKHPRDNMYYYNYWYFGCNLAWLGVAQASTFQCPSTLRPSNFLRGWIPSLEIPGALSLLGCSLMTRNMVKLKFSALLKWCGNEITSLMPRANLFCARYPALLKRILSTSCGLSFMIFWVY